MSLSPAARALSIGLAAALFAGCSGGEKPRPEGARGAEAREALARFGRGRFEVVSFSPGVAKEHEYKDDFGFATRVLALSFEAEIRVVSPLHVPSTSELVARSRESGWEPEQMDDGFQLLMLLGEGDRGAGEAARVRGAAVFDRLLPGERFRAFDRER